MGGGASGLQAYVGQRYEALGVSPQDTVFSKPKYGPGWAGLASPDEFDAVITHGLACKRGFEDLEQCFRDWWMAPGNRNQTGSSGGVTQLGFSGDFLFPRNGSQLLDCLANLQRGPAMRLVDLVAQLASSRVPRPIPPLPPSSAPLAAQQMPPEFEGVMMNSIVNKAQWSSEAQQVVHAYASIVGDPKFRSDAAGLHLVDFHGKMFSDAARSLQGGHLRPIDFLLCKSLVISAPFHRTMAQLFGTKWVPAKMKSFERCWVKCGHDYRECSRPESKHLKDVLRGTVRCETQQDVVELRGLVVQHFGDFGLKDRRHEDGTFDVLQIICFQGLLCEVQFHFAAVLDLKAFSHAAYNIIRVDAQNCYAMQELFEHAYSFPAHQIDDFNRNVRPKVDFS
ncbi:hypothetical protein M885DRAFT_520533 [Pelagophyceae sp. CCMP2097]|nr:hypothetical protein M885DRAFT_520533 [Pelagophyceae sp. CCMP2097]